MLDEAAVVNDALHRGGSRRDGHHRSRRGGVRRVRILVAPSPEAEGGQLRRAFGGRRRRPVAKGTASEKRLLADHARVFQRLGRHAVAARSRPAPPTLPGGGRRSERAPVQPRGGGVRDAALLRRQLAREEGEEGVQLRGDAPRGHAGRGGRGGQEHRQEQLQAGGGRLPQGPPRGHVAAAREPRRVARVLPVAGAGGVLPRLRVGGEGEPLSVPRCERAGRRRGCAADPRLARQGLHHQRHCQRYDDSLYIYTLYFCVL
jgi:hypothetical protein